MAQPAPEGRCAECGAPAEEIDSQRYCGICGHRQPGERDRVELDLGAVAAVSDKGHRHHRNEDAFAIAASESGGSVLVVCDGVSTTENPDVAATAAADAACAVLADALDGPPGEILAALGAAVTAAQAAVEQVPAGADRAGHPSCTLVVSIAVPVGEEWELTTVSLGDSRAYWVDDTGAVALTVDDSWANEQTASGAMAADEARRDPRAHTITRWLGRDAPLAEVAADRRRVRAPGLVVVCSDGLWNYAPTEEAFAAVVGTWGSEAPSTTARRLVEHALGRGGHDNTTVAVGRLDRGDQMTRGGRERQE